MKEFFHQASATTHIGVGGCPAEPRNAFSPTGSAHLELPCTRPCKSSQPFQVVSLPPRHVDNALSGPLLSSTASARFASFLRWQPALRVHCKARALALPSVRLTTALSSGHGHALGARHRLHRHLAGPLLPIERECVVGEVAYANAHGQMPASSIGQQVSCMAGIDKVG